MRQPSGKAIFTHLVVDCITMCKDVSTLFEHSCVGARFLSGFVRARIKSIFKNCSGEAEFSIFLVEVGAIINWLSVPVKLLVLLVMVICVGALVSTLCISITVVLMRVNYDLFVFHLCIECVEIIIR